jgi:CDP-diacylglycerol--serine O-phosphatidyltransferase
VSVNPPVVLFGLFVAYGLSGYVMLLAKFFTRKSAPRPE